MAQLALVRAAEAVAFLGVVVVVDLVAVELVAALAVVLVVAGAAEVPVAAVPAVPVVAAAAVVVAAVAWRAMPRPRALAMPMLSEATRARLRAAGWVRFVLMG